MDKQLLKALDNLSEALEKIAEIMADKKAGGEKNSDVTKALQSGDFSKEIKEINVGVKSIKKDTQEILRQQKTILDMSKKKESDKKTQEFENDPKKESSIKKGVGTILLIAVAVLAIGMAFKIVGKVDFLSVIALGLAITMISITFEKVAKLKMDLKQAAIAALTIVMIAAAITVSSWILKLILPIGITQLLTGIAITVMFSIMGPKVVDIVESMAKIKKIGGGTAQIAQMLMVLVGLSAAITVSSWVLKFITPISIGQMITGIAIATMFYVLSGSIPKIAASVIAVGRLMTKKDIALMPILMAAFSLAVTVSSWVLQYIKPLGFTQMLTGIAITVMFWVVANFLPKLATSIVIVGKIMSRKDIAFMPIIMVAFSAAIMASSWILSFVKPLGFLQMLTGIVITAMFWVIAKFLPDVAVSMVIVDRILGKNKVFLIPLVFTAMALAIMLSGLMFEKVPAMSWKQMVSILVIGVIFAMLSYVMEPMAIGLVIMDKILGKGKMFLIPLIYVAIAVALTVSSMIFTKFADIPFMILLKILVFSAIMTIATILVGIAAIFLAKFVGMGTVLKMPIMFTLVALAIGLSAYIIGLSSKSIGEMSFVFLIKLLFFSVILAIASLVLGIVSKILTMIGGPVTFIKGGLIILILAAVVVGASLILNKGTYKNYPSLSWVIGVGASMAAFGLAAFALGLAVFGPQALIFAAGLGAIVLVAGTIVATSLVIAKGKYNVQGLLPWAVSVALLYGAFVPAIVALGALGLAGGVMKFFGAEDPFEKAKKMMIQIASTIVSVSFILAKGQYKKGPTKEWAEGIAISLGAFSPIYSMLMANGVLKIFGGGGVGPDDFAKAIVTVSGGIMTAAEQFASPKNKNIWKKAPTIEWATGVGMAIGAFAPVLKILSDGAIINLFGGKGVDAAAMKGAIVSISEGIVEAARFFGDPKKLKGVVWSKSYPDKAWGEGVGAALNAFAPVFTALQGKGWFTSGAEVIGEMKMGIVQIADAIVKVAQMLNGYTLGKGGVLIPGRTKPDFKNFPSKEWGQAIGTTVIQFNSIFGLLSRQKGGIAAFTLQSQLLGLVFQSVVNIAKMIKKNEAAFKATIPTTWIDNLSKAALGYAMLTKIIESIYTKKEVYKYPFSSERTETSFVDTNAMGIMGKLMIAMVTTAQILFKNRKAFEAMIPTPWIGFLARQAIGFAFLTKDLESLLTTTEKVTKVDRGILSEKITTSTIKQEKDMSIVARTAANMALVARILWTNKKYFEFRIEMDYMKKVGSNILAFALLTKKIGEMQGGGIGGMLKRLVGQDPMSQMADGMVKIAKAYDILARSLARFGGALSSIDGEKVSIIRRLTGNIAVLASMDAEMFDRVMSVMESRASVFSKLIEADKKARPSVGDKKVGQEEKKSAVSGGMVKKTRTEEQLDQIITQLKAINYNTSGIDEWLAGQGFAADATAKL